MPPTARFPTEIMGSLNEVDLDIPLSYSQFRMPVIKPYISEIGLSRIFFRE